MTDNDQLTPAEEVFEEHGRLRDKVAGLRERLAQAERELDRWRSGQRRKGLPTVAAVPDGIPYAARLARAIGTEGGEEHDRLLSEACQRMKGLHDAATTLLAEAVVIRAERDAMRAVVEAVRKLHEPTLETVEWFHDQTGKGEALCCPSCRPDDPTEWHPPYGQAGIEPDGFVPGYVVSPCPTLAAIDQMASQTGPGATP